MTWVNIGLAVFQLALAFIRQAEKKAIQDEAVAAYVAKARAKMAKDTADALAAYHSGDEPLPEEYRD